MRNLLRTFDLPGTARRLLPAVAAVALIALFALCVSAIAVAAESDTDPLHVPRPTGTDEGAAGKQCIWECQQWTKLCNVDPRGVYSCRRSCARFGEVCEE
jgi:hypothetical protein